MFDVKAILIATVCAFVLGLSAGGATQAWRYNSKISKLKQDAAEANARQSAAVTDQLRKIQAERDGQAQRVAELDSKYAGELNALQTENSRLADCVRSGKCGLRVAATCVRSAGTVGMSSASAAPSVDDGGACRLTQDAGQDYLTLRGAINSQRLQILGLQAYVRELQHSCGKKP